MDMTINILLTLGTWEAKDMCMVIKEATILIYKDEAIKGPRRLIVWGI